MRRWRGNKAGGGRRIGAAMAGLLIAVMVLPALSAGRAVAAAHPAARVMAQSSSSVEATSVAFQGDALHDGFQPAEQLTASTPTKAWSHAFGTAVSYPLIVGGRVFVTAADATGNSASLYALDATTGSVVWGPIELGASRPRAGLAYDAGRIYTVTYDGVLAAFDAASGHQDWSAQLPGQYAFSSAPTAHDGIVYVGGAGSGGTLYATDESSGDLLWSAPVENGDKSSPAVSSTGVYVSYACGNTYGFDPKSGDELWENDGSCEGGGGSTPALHEGVLYDRESGDAFSASDGNPVGTVGSTEPPAFDGGLELTLSGGTLRGVDLATGKVLWSQAGDGTLDTAPFVIGGQVYVGGSSGLLSSYDEHTGVQRWTTNMGSPIAGPDEQSVGGELQGFGAGDGLLVVPSGGTLVAEGGFSSSTTLSGGGQLVPVTPTRVEDTRSTVGGRLAPGGSVTVAVPTSLVPAGAAAVSATVTAADPSAVGNLVAFAGGTTKPATSTVNFDPGQDVANAAIIPLSGQGTLTVTNNSVSSSVDVIVDVDGYFTAAPTTDDGSGHYVPVTPARIADTRPGSGQDDADETLAAGDVLPVQVTGNGGVPESGVVAAVVNLTVTNTTSPADYLTVYPDGEDQPTSSNINLPRGDTRADRVIVPVASDGAIDVYNNAGAADVIVDVAGYFTDDTWPESSGDLFTSTAPTRVLDTRTTGSPMAQTPVVTTLAGHGGLPAAGAEGSAAAAVLNVTEADSKGLPARASSFLTVYPGGSPPLASDLNYPAGDTRPNLDVAALDPAGQVSVVAGTGAADVLYDVVGYFAPAG